MDALRQAERAAQPALDAAREARRIGHPVLVLVTSDIAAGARRALYELRKESDYDRDRVPRGSRRGA